VPAHRAGRSVPQPTSQAPSPLYEFGAFRLDVAERLLLHDGQPLSVTPKAFDLLVYLAARPGRLATKQELMTALWPDTFVEESNLAYTVSALRKALGDGQEREQFIQTVPTRGYRFVASVRALSPVHPETTLRPTVRFRLAFVLTTAALVVLTLVALRLVRPSEGDEWMARQVTSNSPENPVWTGALSPDGRHFAYTDRGGLHLVLVDTGETRTLPPPPGTCFS
jgi:DNA-binding winged helix-turn-helix (wHTH) protein